MGLESKLMKNRIEGDILEGVEGNPDFDLACLEDVDTIGFYSRTGSLLGFIAYRLENNRLSLELVKSFKENSGVFSNLFEELKDIARGNNCRIISLHVAEGNSRAREVYEHYDFYYNEDDYFGKNSQRFLGMSLRI